MRIESLGHVVLRVRDVARAEAFYCGLLGIPVSARAPQWSMTFFTLGEHHDFAVVGLGAEAERAGERTLGMDHVAFRIAGGLAELRAAKEQLEAAGLGVQVENHVVSYSLYFRDPDGNTVELYVNGDEGWREDPCLITSEGAPIDWAAATAARERRSIAAEIRIATLAEADRVRAQVAAFRDHLRAGAPSDAELEARLPALLADPALEFALASAGGADVGYTQTRFFASLWAPGDEALLEDLYVRPEARGGSVGRALLQHALARARLRGARVMTLFTNERNRTAQALYRGVGFAPQRARLWGDGREIRWAIDL